MFPEGEDPRVLRAARVLADDGAAHPILLGDLDGMRRQADDAGMTLEEIELVDPRRAADAEAIAQDLWSRRQRRGITLREARARAQDPMYYGLLMLRQGRADAFVAGADMHYPDTIRPALEVIGSSPAAGHVSGIYMMVFQQQTVFLRRLHREHRPDAETLARDRVGDGGLRVAARASSRGSRCSRSRTSAP